jgi:hypothetical protein
MKASTNCNRAMANYGCGGASLDAMATPDSRMCRNSEGIPGLLATLSNSRRNSWNTLRLYGLRREEYRSFKK